MLGVGILFLQKIGEFYYVLVNVIQCVLYYTTYVLPSSSILLQTTQIFQYLPCSDYIFMRIALSCFNMQIAFSFLFLHGFENWVKGRICHRMHFLVMMTREEVKFSKQNKVFFFHCQVQKKGVLCKHKIFFVCVDVSTRWRVKKFFSGTFASLPYFTLPCLWNSQIQF